MGIIRKLIVPFLFLNKQRKKLDYGKKKEFKGFRFRYFRFDRV